MRFSEQLARLSVIAVSIAAVGLPLFFIRRAPMVHARVAESGGWAPDALQARVGQRLHLLLTSDDVVHGFAVGQTVMPEVEVLPGKVTDVTLLFDKPGTYVFYCTRWCGINHWRMRGTIEVTGPPVAAQPVSPPLYVSLGIDLDAARSAPALPLERPVAELPSEQLAANLAEYRSSAYYGAHSPFQTWATLRQTPAFSRLSDQQLWNATAWIWQSQTTPASLLEGQQLFERNCAACHGESGRGDGVFASQLASGDASPDGMGTLRPADLTDSQRMLAASPALLQGKILRGGMGTGMPAWGQIFTESQTWDLVAHLYSLQFSYR